MKNCIFLVAIVVAVTRAAHFDLEWNVWMKKYEKKYSTLEDEQFRRQIWENTRKKVLEHNMLADQGKKSYWQEVNQFSDMTSEELSSCSCSLPETLQKHCSEQPEGQMPPHPKEIDWKMKKCVTPVKNQKSCQACWIFSVVATIESRYCIKHRRLYNLSEQQIMDCGGFEKPCQPNYLEKALDYVQEVQGLMKGEEYPYIGRKSANGLCLSRRKKYVHIQNLQCKKITSEVNMAAAVKKRGPIPFAMTMTSEFQRFSGKGIYDDADCTRNTTRSHAMTIIGFGHECGLDYWLIKNSWGKRWGNDGFAKIRRNVNLCGINSYALEVDFQ